MSAPDSDFRESKDIDKISFKEWWKISWWTFGFIYKLHPKSLTINLISEILQNMRSLINWAIFSKLLDESLKSLGSDNPQLSDIYPYLTILFIFNFTFVLISYVNNVTSNYIRTYSRVQVTRAFYSKLNYLGIQTLEQPEVNNRINRADQFKFQTREYAVNMIGLIADAIKMVVAATIVFNTVPLLIPVVLLSAVPFILWDKKYRGVLYKFGYVNTEANRRTWWSSSDLGNSVTLQEVSVNRSFSFLDDHFYKFRQWYNGEWFKILLRWVSGSRALRFLSDIIVFGGYIYIFKAFINGAISLGSVTFQINTLNNFQDSLMNMMRTTNDLFESSLQLRDLYLLFNTEPVVDDGDIEFEKLELGPKIEFVNVSFKYPGTDRYVLKNINLTIQSGEQMAFVGHNGAGKTTMVKLLTRFYRPTEGQVLINGINLNKLKLDSYYKNLGVLFQDFNWHPQLTARENIQIGNSSEPLDEVGIHLAAQAADAHEFILELPKKYDTILSEKFKDGVRLSTGQWQKIAIARFFYRNSPLVIFDEPTAAIDAVSEYNIFNKIYEFFKQKTVVIISHRFSTVRNADKIVVIDHGEIVEAGTHEELMSRNGKYANAFMLQAEGYSNKVTTLQEDSKHENIK